MTGGSIGEITFVWEMSTSVEDSATSVAISVEATSVEEAWIKEHEKEAATENPNTGAESEIIEEVKNEADSTDAATATPIDGDSGTRRKLVSVAGRFVSAALRVFGI